MVGSVIRSAIYKIASLCRFLRVQGRRNVFGCATFLSVESGVSAVKTSLPRCHSGHRTVGVSGDKRQAANASHITHRQHPNEKLTEKVEISVLSSTFEDLSQDRDRSGYQFMFVV